MVIRCITASMTQIMNWGFSGEDAFILLLTAALCQAQATSKSRNMQVTIEKAQGAQSC